MIDLVVPCEISELRQVASSGRLIAGGTDVLVQILDGRPDRRLIDVTNLSDAPPIAVSRNGAVELSALAPITDVISASARSLPALAAAARGFGSIQIRNRATLGGNLANASPAADLAVVLVAAGATARVDGATGDREVPVAAIATAPGVSSLALGEWISTVSVPLPEGEEGFRKLGARQAHAIAIVNLAWRWSRAPDGALSHVRLAYGSVAPTIVRATEAEAELEGHVPTPEVIARATRAASTAVAPIDDIRASARYRRAMVAELLREALLNEDRG